MTAKEVESVEKMTSKQRLKAALVGEPVDRAPIWLREGFPVAEAYPSQDDFSSAWMWAPLYRELYEHVAPHADAIRSWGIGGWGNRFLMIPPNRIHATERQVSPDVLRSEGYIDTPRGKLPFINEKRRGHDTWWHVKPPVGSLADLIKLSEVPFSVTAEDMAPYAARYEQVYREVGERGLVRMSYSSPIVCISGCMRFDLFLELSLAERGFFHELLAELSRRGVALIDALFQGRELDTLVNFGGSEQCTPPMMAPQAYAEYVAPYDGPMVARLKEYGILTSCHCHGKIAHALRCMIDIGYDGTDPVEPPPAGDVTYAQAREIAGDRITVEGNLEWDEMCFSEPGAIRERVVEILSHGARRLILSTSAGPVSAIDERLAANYRALVDTVLEYS